MIVRIRTSEGMFRLDVGSDCTIDQLRAELRSYLPRLSPAAAASVQFFQDAGYQRPVQAPAHRSLGLKHGDLIFTRLPEGITLDDSSPSSSVALPSSSAAVAGPSSSTRRAPTQSASQPSTSTAATASPAKTKAKPLASVSSSNQEPAVVEDAVDTYLEQQSGLIERKRDDRFCNHSSRAMCDYCMPIEPFDPNYLAEHAIKYLSFHSYLRQQTASSRVATTKGSSNSAGKANSKAAAAPGGMGVTVSTHPPRGADQMRDGKRIIPPPLEEPSYRVKVPCPAGHPSWPASICTKCQPGTITLQRQTFRMVDHVCFAHSDLVDRFIQYWRQTGTQRFGYLYGRYEPYTKVPLGIQAVVEAIYEPPQETAGDGLKVDMEWPGLARIDELARSCDGPGGLQLVGMIFTDLVDDGKGTGQVVCKRHLDTYFLSSLECIFSAEMQRRHPNPCKWSTSGHFGSKFVTVVVSGNAERNIDLAAYQMSTTAMALSEADVVEPTYDPSLVRVKPAEAHQRYVPDIMYKYKNEYNTVVSKNAKPVFPVEYLITTLTHGFPDQPAPRFVTPEPFPIVNRGALQTVPEPNAPNGAAAALARHLFPADRSANSKRAVPSFSSHLFSGAAPLAIERLSDFHLLSYIAQTNLLTDTDLAQLAQLATTTPSSTQRATLIAQLEQSPSWLSFCRILQDAAPSASNRGHGSGSGSNSGPGSVGAAGHDAIDASTFEDWGCRHCTYLNPSMLSECEMCGLPKDQ